MIPNQVNIYINIILVDSLFLQYKTDIPVPKISVVWEPNLANILEVFIDRILD